MAQIGLKVQDDASKAWVVSIERQSDSEAVFTEAMLWDALREQGVVFGIDEKALSQAVETLRQQGLLPTPILVARAQPPEPPAAIEFVRPIAITDKSSLSTEETIWVVKRGEVFAKKVDAASGGTPGRNVRGEEIPPKSALPPKPGKNITVSHDGRNFIATQTGLLIIDNDKFDIITPIHVSGDEMSATFTPEPGWERPPFQKTHLRALLSELGVIHGVDDKTLDLACAPAKSPKERPAQIELAKGIPAVHGQNARMQRQVDFTETAGTINEDGRIDFRERKKVVNVSAGQVLAIKISATQGETGITVTGKSIAANPGKDIVPKPAKNTKLSPDGIQIIAEVEGVAVPIGTDGVMVVGEYKVSGDVDYSTGNIHSKGHATVGKSVRTDFKVEAEGNVQVGGDIGHGSVFAGGDILVNGGIIGKPGAMVQAGGKIKARYAENAEIECGADIEFTNSALNCNIRTRGMLIAVEASGLLAGGSLLAEKGVKVKELGSALGVPTNVVVGVNPQARVELEETVRSLKKVENRLRQLDSMLGPLLPRLKTLKLPPERMKHITERMEERSGLVKQRERLNMRKQELGDELNKDTEAEVRVMGKVHPGTVVTIKWAKKELKNPVNNVLFKYNKDTAEVDVVKL